MRTQITADPGYDNRVTLRYEDEGGELVTRDVFAPYGGGYVREDWSNPRQVCERLERFGSTLIWSGSTPLVDLIRWEYRRRRAAQRRAETRESRYYHHSY